MSKVVIVGGVAGGMSAATRLRRLAEDAEIIVFEKGPYVSFANCGLPYHLSGTIPERTSLMVQSPEALWARFKIDARPNHEVISIHPQEKIVEVQHRGKVFQESYDELILATGASAVIPQIEGLAQAENVHTLRNIPDMDEILNQLEQGVQNATIVGAGFIGVEMVENLHKRGIHVTLVEKATHVLPNLDAEMAAFVEEELLKNNVDLQLSKAVAEIKGNGTRLVLDDGTQINSDLTILSVGVQPNSALAENAGLQLGLKKGIMVDENYETSVKHVYAVGDVAVTKQQITNEPTLIPLASPANRQGRQVADVLAGLRRVNRGSIGTAIVQAFNLSAASTGLSEQTARQEFANVLVAHVSGTDHATYYPNSQTMWLKLIFDGKTGQIYGAQAVGANGVDKRIDVLATAIKGNLSVFDLPELELTYAPPFGTAKDVVNMVGYVATNLVEGLSKNIQWHELSAELAKGKQLLDLRDPKEIVRDGRIKGATNIPLNQLREHTDLLDPHQEYVLYCQSGLRSYVGERILRQKGFKVENLDGAFGLYKTIMKEEVEQIEKY